MTILAIHTLLYLCALSQCTISVDTMEHCGAGAGEALDNEMVGNIDTESCNVGGDKKNGGKVALVLGASGETGKQVLEQLVNDSVFTRIVSVGRRELDLATDPLYKKVEQKVVDFDNLEKYRAEFDGIDVAFCCLGTTRAKSGAAGFVTVDHDYVLHAAKLLKSHKCPEFHLLTSKGTNENSWLLYPSTKGKVEKAITSLGFDHLTIYRPGLLLCEREDRRFFENILQSIARNTDKSSWWSVTTKDVAKAMVATSKKSEKKTVDIVEHDRIVNIAQIN